MTYSIDEIQNIIGGKLIQAPKNLHPEIEHLVNDSRKVSFPKTSLFFAIKSSRNDGHQYIKELYEKGLQSFIVEEKIALDGLEKAAVVLVQNSVAALQKIAAHHRQQFDLQTIGITGSNGKTIVKEWLFQLLNEDFEIVRSPKSYNSQIGVPLSVWQIQAQHQMGIFEAGISQKNEMKNLAPIIHCDIGIFTNIGAAHSEGFKNNNEKIREKIKLFATAKTIIYCSDDKAIDKSLKSKYSDKNLFAWSYKEDTPLQIISVKTISGKSTKIKGLQNQNRPVSINIPFSDDASIQNAIHCWASMLFLDYDSDEISRRFEALNPVAMRLEIKEGINNCTLINDSYNSDLTSLSIAMNFLEQQSNTPSRTVILSDILQSGQASEKLYKEVADLMLEKRVRKVIGIGETIKGIKAHFPKQFPCTIFETTAQFLKEFNFQVLQNEVILVKGARHFHFEKIADRISKKMHKTVLEINLNALIHNLNFYKKKLAPKTKIMAMVKASAYGSGSVEVAKLLQYHKVDYLAVAYADEGIELREAGIKLPILVLNPEPATFESLIRYDLEPEIYSLGLLRQLLEIYPTARIHLKIDTGMHRLGFEEKDLGTMISLLKKHPEIKVKSIFSHLSGSESAEFDDYSKQQISTFDRIFQHISGKIGYKPARHILNSAGILRFPQYQFEMVRLGIGLYGIDSSAKLQNQLAAVHTLKATISQIKQLKKGDTTGYSRSGVALKDSRIATISIGYADGLARALGNGAYKVSIQGKLAPIIGNVCMDMCMIDVSKVPNASEGDEVILFGPGLPVIQLAHCLNTIPYEVFTAISDRVKRVYFQE